MLSSTWQTTGDCTAGNRVEVALIDDHICVRNSDNPAGDVLRFTRAEWDAFVLGARDGEFDLEEDAQ